GGGVGYDGVPVERIGVGLGHGIRRERQRALAAFIGLGRARRVATFELRSDGDLEERAVPEVALRRQVERARRRCRHAGPGDGRVRHAHRAGHGAAAGADDDLVTYSLTAGERATALLKDLIEELVLLDADLGITPVADGVAAARREVSAVFEDRDA